MSILSRQTRTPLPFSAQSGADVATLIPDLDAQARELITGIAGCSPYLAQSLSHERDWVAGALADPEAALAQEMAQVAALAPDMAGPGLRASKRRVALVTALADLAGAWSLSEVTGAISRFADASVGAALRAGLWPQLKRGKIPGMDETALENCASIAVLAMGKGGAFELNYSSDIDLIALFDDSQFDPDDLAEARSGLVRAVRKMVGLLSDVTAEGYVFRTDLRLRPDPSVTPVCLSMSAAEHYYESVGRNWERAAYIKARAAAGDIAAGAEFLRLMRPFVWRKHLDFATIHDTHEMRLKIRDHKKLGGALRLEGHNLKLGRGGIREIEFFTQTRQLVAGGRNPSLRDPTTLGGLSALAKADWIKPDQAATLSDHYCAHREVEHRLQMINDSQTHSLPNDAEGFARLAAFMGIEDADLRRDLTDRIEEVHALTEDYFAPTAQEDHKGATDEIEEIGAEITAAWPGYPALRSQRAVDIFERLRPQLFARFAKAKEPEAALRQFDRFLRGLPAGVQLFSLFEANAQLTRIITDICASAPALAEYLAGHTQVFDAVIGGDFFAPWPDDLNAQAAALMAGDADYESKLRALRRWNKEWHFRIGVHLLENVISGSEAGRQYGALARASVAALFPVVVDEFSRKYGPPPGRGAALLGMGSLGVGQMHTLSDLDLILLYDPAGETVSAGPKSLSVTAYYARLTQALITAAQAPMAEGKLYEIDMRLRPSGRTGAVATSLASFEAYQRDEAWVWEHMALTRAQVIAGPADFCADIEAARARIVALRGNGRDVVGELGEMRTRLQEARPSAPWSAKNGAGRLQDIQLAAQALALLSGSRAGGLEDQLASAVDAKLIAPNQAATLEHAAKQFWELHALLRLLVPETQGQGQFGADVLERLLQHLEQPDKQSAEAALERLTSQAVAVIDALFPCKELSS